MTARVDRLHFAPSAGVPNTPLPVLAYRAAFAPADPGAVCAMMERNGWGGTWVWTVFDYHHYHPDAHEALAAVAAGNARILLGGPDGTAVEVSAGDALILPAGTCHCRLSQSDDVRICGAYPPGMEGYSTWRIDPDRSAEASQIAASLPLPATDPILGTAGPLIEHWRDR